MVCGVSAALIASCEKSSVSPYVPEVQKDDEPSGIGYARKLFPGKGDVLFTVSRQSSGTETLAIRACGKAEADINVNGQHYSAVFQKGGSTWEVVAVSVQQKGRRCNGNVGRLYRIPVNLVSSIFRYARPHPDLCLLCPALPGICVSKITFHAHPYQTGLQPVTPWKMQTFPRTIHAAPHYTTF